MSYFEKATNLLRCGGKLILESDCLLMIKECLSSGNSFSKYESMVTKIKRLQASFESCKLQHIYKEQYRLAHILAQHASVLIP